MLLSATCYDLRYFCYCLFSKLAMELKDGKNNGNVKNIGGRNSYKVCFLKFVKVTVCLNLCQ